MLTVIEVLVVLVVLFFAAAVATQEREVLVDVPRDAPDLGLPVAGLQPEDVAAVRFGLAVRGYRMSEVDEVLARLGRELADRDARITALEQALVEVVEPHVAELESRTHFASETFEAPSLWPQPAWESEPEPMLLPEPPVTSDSTDKGDADAFGRNEGGTPEEPPASESTDNVDADAFGRNEGVDEEVPPPSEPGPEAADSKA